MSSHVRFVRSLILDKSLTSHPIKAAAEVVAGSLASFTSKVSGPQLRDVHNSTLLAQLAATAKFPKQEQVEDWYNFYGNVLGELGWITQSFSFDTYKSDQASFKLSEVTLELLSPLVGGEEKVVKNTLDSLAQSQSGLTLFNTNSTSNNSGRYQILPCQSCFPWCPF